MIDNPLSQFEINTLLQFNLLGMHFPITNAAVAMLFALFCSILILLPASFAKEGKVTRAHAAGEMIYNTISAMALGAAGLEVKKFIPLIFTLFLFILMCNLVGVIPGSFTATSHIAVTLFVALLLFIFTTALGFIKHGTKYLSLFLPQGVPVVMAPLLILIELFAYLARPISLSIRLTANMIAGHIVIKVLAAFVAMSGLLGIFPLALLVVLTGFEIFVSILQAYIFSVLTCVYLNDALNLH